MSQQNNLSLGYLRWDIYAGIFTLSTEKHTSEAIKVIS